MNYTAQHSTWELQQHPGFLALITCPILSGVQAGQLHPLPYLLRIAESTSAFIAKVLFSDTSLTAAGWMDLPSAFQASPQCAFFPGEPCVYSQQLWIYSCLLPHTRPHRTLEGQRTRFQTEFIPASTPEVAARRTRRHKAPHCPSRPNGHARALHPPHRQRAQADGRVHECWGKRLCHFPFPGRARLGRRRALRPAVVAPRTRGADGAEAAGGQVRGVGARRALPLRARCDRSARGGSISAGTGPASPRGGAASHLSSRCAPGRPGPVLPAGEAPRRRAAVRARRCGRQRRERAGGRLGARRPERCLRVGVSQLVTSLREDRPAARKASLGGSRGTAWSCVFGGDAGRMPVWGSVRRAVGRGAGCVRRSQLQGPQLESWDSCLGRRVWTLNGAVWSRERSSVSFVGPFDGVPGWQKGCLYFMYC